MMLQIPRPLLLVPPIILPLMAYILSSLLCWGILYEALPSLYGIFYIYAASLFLVFFYKKAHPYTVCLIIGATLLGPIRSCQIFSHYRSFPFALTSKPSTICGTFSSYSYNSSSRFPYCNTIAMRTVGEGEMEQYTPHFIHIYTQRKVQAEIGDTITIKNIMLKKPNNDQFYLYLMKEGVSATAFVPDLPVTIKSHSAFSSTRWLFQCKKQLVRSFRKQLSNLTFQLFATIFLGEKETTKQQKEAREDPFRKWGIIHYLARSGLHLVIIVSLCELPLRCIPIGFMLKQLLLTFAVLLYSLLTWPSISFLRALLIFFLYIFCKMIRIPYHVMHLILLCCFILLIVNPLYIFFLDFQLSFGLTLALAWLNLFRTVSPTAD